MAFPSSHKLSAAGKRKRALLENLDASSDRRDGVAETSPEMISFYFFENDLLRALRYAQTAAENPDRHFCARKIVDPAVVGAVICLGNCLDLTTQAGLDEFCLTHQKLLEEMPEGWRLPENKRAFPEDEDLLLHNLDRAVFNELHRKRLESGCQRYDNVRNFFTKANLRFRDPRLGSFSRPDCRAQQFVHSRLFSPVLQNPR